MEPRLSETYEVNQEMVDTAARRVGYDYCEPNEVEKAYFEGKGLTILQWKLLKLFKFMFDQELQRCRQIQDLQGWHGEKDRVRFSGLTFCQKMTQNEEIAESIFKSWATNLGIRHLYDISRKGDENDIEDRTHDFDACIDGFQRELKKVRNRKKYRVVEPEYKPGTLVSISIQGLRNTSGKSVYQRFVQVLKLLS